MRGIVRTAASGVQSRVIGIIGYPGWWKKRPPVRKP